MQHAGAPRAISPGNLVQTRLPMHTSALGSRLTREPEGTELISTGDYSIIAKVGAYRVYEPDINVRVIR